MTEQLMTVEQFLVTFSELTRYVTTPIDPDVKERWVKALRSGKYEQGRGGLCTIDENGVQCFCCHGVLADMEISEPWVYSEHESFVMEKDGSSHVLSEAYQARIGMDVRVHNLLAQGNDDGIDFPTIARAIERYA